MIDAESKSRLRTVAATIQMLWRSTLGPWVSGGSVIRDQGLWSIGSRSEHMPTQRASAQVAAAASCPRSKQQAWQQGRHVKRGGSRSCVISLSENLLSPVDSGRLGRCCVSLRRSSVQQVRDQGSCTGSWRTVAEASSGEIAPYGPLDADCCLLFERESNSATAISCLRLARNRRANRCIRTSPGKCTPRSSSYPWHMFLSRLAIWSAGHSRKGPSGPCLIPGT